MNRRASRSFLIGSALVFLSCARSGAAEATETVTVQFPSGERVVGHVLEQNETRIVLESAVLGRIEASAVGISIARHEAGQPTPTATAAAVAEAPPPSAPAEPVPIPDDGQKLVAVLGFMDMMSKFVPQPGWTDWFRGWHGLLTMGSQFENRSVAPNRQRILGFGEIAKKVDQTEVRLSSLYFMQSTESKKEVDHLEVKLRLRHGFGPRWVFESENTFTRNPPIFGLKQESSANSLNYRPWQSPRGEFQFGPGFVVADTRFGFKYPDLNAPTFELNPLNWPDRHVRSRTIGLGGQAHLKWRPLTWLAFQSDALTAEFPGVMPGFDFRLASVKSRLLMLTHKPWTISLRHEYNRVELRGLVRIPEIRLFGVVPLVIPPFTIPAYKESILWLDFGYIF